MMSWVSGGRLATQVKAGAAVAALLAVSGAVGMRSAAVATRKQGEQRAVPLVQDCLGKLGMIDRGITINVETMTVPATEQPNRKLWAAECEDTLGNYVAYVLVDSRSGEVVAATCSSNRAPAPGTSPLSRGQAIAEAAKLVRRCTPVSITDNLRLAGEPEKSGDMWYVPLKSGKRSLGVSIQASTGAVLALTNKGPISTIDQT